MSEDGWWSVDYPLSGDLLAGQQKKGLKVEMVER
jgi:hypothetical protein